MSRMYTTKNDLPESTRKEVITLLNQNLADAIHLGIQAKQAHWNVKGPQFFQLHELFDKVHEQAREWADLLAERAAQLGGVAEGNLESTTHKTRLPGYSLELSSGRDHVDALSGSLALFAKSVRDAIRTAEQAGDLDTADIFTEISRETDKMLWFVEAHLQADR